MTAPKGLLLLQLGTPDAPTNRAVRHYLREFLSDPRVIDIPALARWLLLNTIILPFRTPSSAKAYQKIWTTEGSPLLTNSQNFASKLAHNLGDNYRVALGMRYGNPSIKSALLTLQEQRCESIFILPLFPQYSSAATGSAIERALDIIKSGWNIGNLTVLNDFFNHPLFIKAYSTHLKTPLAAANADHVLFSFHGLPERHIKKSGCEPLCGASEACPEVTANNRYCYRAQCYATTRALAESLALSTDQYSVAFQSRLGRTPWIQPYTDQLLPKLIERGIKRLAIACPSFVADCLETLEEIGLRAREDWRALGGDELILLPCINDAPEWVAAAAMLVQQQDPMNNLNQ